MLKVSLWQTGVEINFWLIWNNFVILFIVFLLSFKNFWTTNVDNIKREEKQGKVGGFVLQWINAFQVI